MPNDLFEKMVPTLETSPFDISQGDQQGEGSPKGQLDHLEEGEQCQKSPATKPLNVLTQTKATAPMSSQQANKDVLVYKRRKMGVKHEIKA